MKLALVIGALSGCACRALDVPEDLSVAPDLATACVPACTCFRPTTDLVESCPGPFDADAGTCAPGYYLGMLAGAPCCAFDNRPRCVAAPAPCAMQPGCGLCGNALCANNASACAYGYGAFGCFTP